MIYDVVKATAILHRHGFVHRSLRVSSVRLLHDLSEIHPNSLIKLVPDKPLTPFGQTTRFKCPKPYRPPEHTFELKAHPAYDIYQLGLYIMEVCMQINFWQLSPEDRKLLTAGLLPTGETAKHGYNSWQKGEYAPVELRQLTLTMLNVDFLQRPSAVEVLQQLETILLNYSRSSYLLRKVFALVPISTLQLPSQIQTQPQLQSHVRRTHRWYELSKEVLKLLPELNVENLTKGNKLHGTYDAYVNYRGKLKVSESNSIPVRIKEFYPTASEEYLLERDSLLMNLSKPEFRKFTITTYGYNDSKLWLIFGEYNMGLDIAFETAKNLKKPIPISQRMRILYNIAQSVQALAHPTPTLLQSFNHWGQRVKHFEPVIRHRDIKPENIFLMSDCFEAFPDIKSMADVDALPPLAVLGDDGCATTKSKSFKSGSRGDIYYMPPEAIEDGYSYDVFADIWRIGLICYQIWTQTHFDKITEVDKERIIIKRLKPKESTDAEKDYNVKWMGFTAEAASPLFYEIAQVGLWQMKCKDRPPIDIIVKVMRWLLEDALIAEGQLPSRDKSLPKTDNPEAVVKHLGWSFSPVYASSKVIGPRAPEPMVIIE